MASKSSDYFREMVGDRVLMYNPAARALYATLKGWEDHHSEVHKDCEDAMRDRVLEAMRALSQTPLGISSGDTTKNTQKAKP